MSNQSIMKNAKKTWREKEKRIRNKNVSNNREFREKLQNNYIKWEKSI